MIEVKENETIVLIEYSLEELRKAIKYFEAEKLRQRTKNLKNYYRRKSEQLNCPGKEPKD
jgi:hypothetical protein